MDADTPRFPRAGRSGSPTVAAAGGERELVAALLQNDRKAAAQFVAAHSDAIYGYVRHRLLPRVDLVDDVVQEVFLAALRALGTFEGTSSLRAWLIGIARHKVDDLYRQQLRAPQSLPDEGDEQPASDDPSIDIVLDAERLRERTRTVLGRLPERYSFLLLWRYWEQKSTREIAAALSATEKSVERMLARARSRFKEIWLQE